MIASNDTYASLSREQLLALLGDARGPQRRRIQDALNAAPVVPATVVPPVPVAPPVLVPPDGKPAAPTVEQVAGAFALQILTPEQQAQVSEHVSTLSAAQQVQEATQALAVATMQVQQAAQAAQAVVQAVPESVDTSALEAAIAAAQPVVAAVSAPESATPVPGKAGAPVEAPAS